MALITHATDLMANPDDYDRTLGQLGLLAATTRFFGRDQLDHAVSILHGALMSGQCRV